MSGLVFLPSFAGIASGSTNAVVVLGFWAGVIVAFTWLAAVSINPYRSARG